MKTLHRQSGLVASGCGVKVHCSRIAAKIRPEAVTEVFSQRKGVSILGGNDSQGQANRFSVWAAGPREIFVADCTAQDPLKDVQETVGKYRLDGRLPREWPTGMFCGGWIGYFSYDLDRFIEDIDKRAADDLHLPLIKLCFYDSFVCYDRAEDVWWIVALEMPEDGQRPAVKLASLAELLHKAQQIRIRESAAGDMDDIDITRLGCNMSRDRYFDALERIGRHIYNGDVYQINFSQRFERDFGGRAVDLYHWQNRHNESPYAAYIDAGDFAIVSASPEMFITVRDRVISTKPIKGTRRRLVFGDNVERTNKFAFADLVESEKDQAELNMIVDLERNDLARICVPGTRHVSMPRTIETYPTVFHAVATVEGRLRDDCGFSDILRAMFPGGSITGAPKIRAMEIIDQLEPTQRGVYTGSIGYIGVDGGICLNIAIRTIIVKDGKAYAQTGGGIVADSVAADEWEETITKARALLAGIEAVQGRL
jgi:para-aminobenzoate synthetase component 1